MKDYIGSLNVEARLHRFPWWLENAAEECWPVHDPPAVWKSWGVVAGGLPVLESLPGVPFTPPRYAADDDGLPTYEALSTQHHNQNPQVADPDG